MLAKRVIPREEFFKPPGMREPPKQSWRFCQTCGVGNPLKFPDGSEFTFRRIQTNTGDGFRSDSSAEITDPVLADKLRDYAKRFPGSVFEVGSVSGV